jgi:TonB family protein
VFTAQIPKIPKPFIVPGRRTPTPPDPALPPPPPPPNIDLASATPAINPPISRLVLPPAPPPVIEDQPPKPLTALPPSRVGDPANILSLSDRPVAPTDKLLVPPGNVLGATGDGVILRAGTETGDSSGAAARSGDGRSNGPGAAGAANGANTGASSAANGANSGVNGGRGAGAAGTPGIATGVSIIGAGTNANPPIPKGGMQRRASNGTFDAVVVQSSSTDPFPESKELLTGRPIYTVYVALGTPKDWALYFCVPGEKDASPGGNVVKMGTGAPVQAPYPTTLVRPDVAVPSFYKQVLVHGYVTAAGKVENLKVVRPIKPETDQALLAALARWDFRPATRQGVNIGVEFVISIPVAGL